MLYHSNSLICYDKVVYIKHDKNLIENMTLSYFWISVFTHRVKIR